jgi:large subunit ribosomal protein L18
MGKTNPKAVSRIRRKKRIRAKISGTAERPRMTVFRSSKHIYVQVIDDVTGVTLASASDVIPALREELNGKKKAEKAFRVGQIVASACKEKGIDSVVFDRNGFVYHGRIKAVADGARDGGLEF